MGGYLLAWFCLSRRPWTSVELKIFQYLIGIALVGMRPLGSALGIEKQERARCDQRAHL